MLPLIIPIVAQFLPSLLGELFGKRAEDVAKQVSDVATGLFGSNDKDAIEKAIASNAALALEFKSKLLEIQDREAERSHQERLAELNDVQSARGREIALRDVAVPRLALAILGVFAVVSITVMYGCYVILTEGLKVKDINVAIAVSGMVGTVVGYVSAKADQVVSYYFGSSAGSKAKTESLTQSVSDFAKAAISNGKKPA